MSPTRHNLTRRALLGAAAGLCAGDGHLPAVPLSAAARGRPQASVPAWSRALAAYRRAEAAIAAFRRFEASLPAAARAFPACEPLEDRFLDLECARLAALRRLLRAPAPDLPALALKIELAVDNQIAELSDGDLCLAALKADSRRLLAARA